MFLTATSTTWIYTLSLHDALPILDAGSCNGCELEIAGLTGPHYDLERFGLSFVASPRHADCLLVTGPVTSRQSADRKSTRLNSSHTVISYAVFCLKKKNKITAASF